MNLKKTILILFVGALTVAGCKKSTTSKPITPELVAGKSFAQITYADIMTVNKKMDNTKIAGVSSVGVKLLKPGAIILYKTNLGSFGKLKVVSIGDAASNYELTIDLITYSSDGSKVLLDKPGLTIEGTCTCNLNTGVACMAGKDFQWNRIAEMETYFEPRNNAVFYVYAN